jgi:hypothetical protein
MYDNQHTWVWLNATNNENSTQSFVVLLQLQNKDGYVTQLVESQQFTLRPFEQNATIVTAEYHNETGKRLLDIFVWTRLDHPEPLTRYQYIVNMDDEQTFAETRISNEGAVMISRLLSACDDGEPTCDVDYLEIVSQRCSDLADFKLLDSNSICNDQRLEQYRSTETPNPSSNNVTVTLERTGCFGFCPSYSLVIYGNGTVQYQGHYYVAVKGNQTATIPRQDVEILLNTANEIGYFDLKDEYFEPITDLPTYITSITVNGTTKRIVDYAGAPDSLRQFEDLIDDVAGSHRWVKCPDGRLITERDSGCT